MLFRLLNGKGKDKEELRRERREEKKWRKPRKRKETRNR